MASAFALTCGSREVTAHNGPYAFPTVTTVCAFYVFLGSAAFAQKYSLRSARIFDSITGRITSPGLVVVANRKIQSVGGSVPAGVEVIDLGNATLMPGFIDAHTHLTNDFNPDYNGESIAAIGRG